MNWIDVSVPNSKSHQNALKELQNYNGYVAVWSPVYGIKITPYEGNIPAFAHRLFIMKHPSQVISTDDWHFQTGIWISTKNIKKNMSHMALSLYEDKSLLSTTYRQVIGWSSERGYQQTAYSSWFAFFSSFVHGEGAVDMMYDKLLFLSKPVILNIGE